MTFYFAPVFKYIFFICVLICLLLITGFWTNMVGGWLSRRRGRRSRRANKAEQDETQQAVQQDDLVQQQATQQDDDDQQQDDNEAKQTASCSGASGSRSIYLRCPASLPQRPILWYRRPLIRSDGERRVTLYSSSCSYYVFKIII
jgi:FtsZ-interacting cell division protein ZipA